MASTFASLTPGSATLRSENVVNRHHLPSPKELEAALEVAMGSPGRRFALNPGLHGVHVNDAMGARDVASL